MSKPFRIAMIPASTDGVNYYRLATWAFEMRKYKNTIVDLLWFKYEIDPSRPHPWQEDLRGATQEPSGRYHGLSISQEIYGDIDRACELADVVVWHPMFYEWTLDLYLEMQHKHQKPFVVDVDDNFVDVPPWNEAYRSFQNGQDYRRISLDSMRNADALFVTTSHLAKTYVDINDAIHVMPNSLDFKGDRTFVGWDEASVRKHSGVRIGWIGGRSHFNDLMMVAPAIVEVLKKHPEVTFTMVNSAMEQSCQSLGKEYPFAKLKNVRCPDRSVAINRYAAFMASFGFDVGIAPLVDCNFNRSKSNLRWLEYSALRIPTVATDISHFRESIDPGSTGLLVADNGEQQWADAINFLVEDSSPRGAIGRAAYKKVKTDFNVARNAANYLRALKQIAEAGSFAEIDEQEVLVA